MSKGKYLVRYADTGEPYPLVKEPRPRLCHKCHGFATIGLEEVKPIVIIDLEAKVSRSFTVVTTYFCEYHGKFA